MRFGPSPGRAAISPSSPGSFLFSVSSSSKCPVLTISALAGQILADPRQLRQIVSGLQQACDRLGQALDLARGTAVGADAKLVLSPNLEEFGGLVEHGGDFRVLNRHIEDPRNPDFAKQISHGSTGRI